MPEVQEKYRSKNSRMTKINKGKLLLPLKCALIVKKIKIYKKKQEASGLLSSLGLKTTLS